MKIIKVIVWVVVILLIYNIGFKLGHREGRNNQRYKIEIHNKIDTTWIDSVKVKFQDDVRREPNGG